MREKQMYLGDSVYAEFDGYHIVLYTDNGLGRTNEIFLDPRVLQALERYKKALNETKEQL